ncbi:MAG: AAA family ATPase [Deltaproteobacteria bacterium]|nr:AAA family ATPase [Deltaproteobacteria bacterium]
MYESFYGLKEKPFNLLPDPEYLFMSQGHENTYTHLEYAIAENKGFVVITGEIGSGKTTLINFLLERIGEDIDIGLINNTYVRPTQLIKMICKEYELEVEGMDKTEMIELFHGFLLRQFAERKRVVLIIDEAQNLSAETMEEIRMLSNLEAEKHHLLQMILVGQPELKHKLQRKELCQFAQRVTVSCHLNGLNKEEVDKYIRHRLKVAVFGAKNPDIFNPGAIAVIASYSRGIPRVINILCDTALVYGYADELKVIDEKAIEHVIRAREAGGIFSGIPQDEKGETSSAPTEDVISGSLENRLGEMERRIRLMEDVVGGMGQRVDNLVQKKNERDTIVLELFKMLKKSMESRFNALRQVDRLKKDRNTNSKDIPQERNRAVVHPRLHFKKEGKVTKA